MPPPDPSSQPESGRHRQAISPSRLRPLSLLLVFLVLLGSGTALAKLTAMPVESRPTELGVTALGEVSTKAPSPAPSEPASPAPAAPAPVGVPPEPSPRQEPAPEPRPGAPDQQGDEVTAQEDEVTALTNEERAAAGCDEVGTDERLRTAARSHSQDMADNGYFSHTGQDGSSFVDRAESAGYPRPAGENIAMGYRTPADVVRGWMNSDGHRRNMLSCSHQMVGVGLAYNDNGQPYWTQVFGR